MTSKRKIAMLAGLAAALGATAVTAIIVGSHKAKPRPNVIQGAVVKHDTDAKQESPIEGVEVSAADGLAAHNVKTDFSGAFRLTLNPQISLDQPVLLNFQHPDYIPVTLHANAGDNLYVVKMAPVHGEAEAALNEKQISVANVMVRYSTVSMSSENIGTGEKTFQVVNQGNLPCDTEKPCSPDGRWKGSIGSATMDAGEGNVFQDGRVSCVAGPCPFTKIVIDTFSRPARVISVSVLGWSDTTTFLLQAEVYRTASTNLVRMTYPVIFGRSLNFTLPADSQGPTLEAEMDGSQIIFPLAPNPILSWADCSVRDERKQGKVYRCELKPGYSFK
jgi:hypothetical protein